MANRSLNRPAVLTLLCGGMVIQALLGGLRSLTLAHDRAFTMAAFSTDPLADVWVNAVVGVLSVAAAAYLLTGRRSAWIVSVLLLVVGCGDALSLSVAPFGGAQYWILFALRFALLVLFMTPLVRAMYGLLSAR